MKTIEIYVAPVVKVIEVEVEKGFAVSSGYGSDSDDSELNQPK